MALRRPSPVRPRLGHQLRTHARATGHAAVLAGVVLAGSAAYEVQLGESLSQIAVRNGVSTAALAEANGILDLDRLVAGQRLTIPAAGTSARAAPAAGRHVVQPGESLWTIAALHGISRSELAAHNGLTNPDLIVAGRSLELPGAARVERQAETSSSRSSGRSVPASVSRDEAAALIERVARDYGWKPAFVRALAYQESGLQQSVVSHTGAVGIMQVLPSTGRWVSDNLVGRQLDLSDPEDNVIAGVAFLDYVHGLTGGDVRATLGGYYQGLASIRRNGMWPDTERYIDNVLALRDRFS